MWIHSKGSHSSLVSFGSKAEPDQSNQVQIVTHLQLYVYETNSDLQESVVKTESYILTLQ